LAATNLHRRSAQSAKSVDKSYCLVDGDPIPEEVIGKKNNTTPIPAAGRQAASGVGMADERMSCGAFIDVPPQKKKAAGQKAGQRAAPKTIFIGARNAILSFSI
jgi:hypothetical protein